MWKIIILFFLLLSGCSAKEESITLAIASSLVLPMQEIIESYSKESNVRIEVVSGSSSVLATQIENGLEVDLFFSAEVAQNKRLGIVVEELIGNQMVVMKHNDAPYIESILDLQKDSFVIAHPESVPAGSYAKRWCDEVGVSTVLTGKDLAITSNYVVLKEVDYAISYYTEALKHQLEVVDLWDEIIPLGFSIIHLNKESEAFFAYVNTQLELFINYGFVLLS